MFQIYFYLKHIVWIQKVVCQKSGLEPWVEPVLAATVVGGEGLPLQRGEKVDHFAVPFAIALLNVLVLLKITSQLGIKATVS